MRPSSIGPEAISPQGGLYKAHPAMSGHSLVTHIEARWLGTTVIDTKSRDQASAPQISHRLKTTVPTAAAFASGP
jgi:hypothetical protein